MRPAISLLLLAALAIGGCDRQSQPQSQANETIAASNASDAAPAPATNEATNAAGKEGATNEVIGTLDRSHRGELGPSLAFLDPASSKTSLSAFLGKPLLLNLWATWCAPCVQEMPTLDALAVSLGDSVTVLVLAQEITNGPAKVDAFFQKSGFRKLQPYLDEGATFSTAMAENLPVTILYDSNGKEVWRMRGAMDWTGETARELIAEAK